MAAVTVTFDGTRVNTAEAITNWVGATQESEFVYQGSFSNSVQVKTSENGEYYNNAGTTHDFTSPQSVWIAKAWITNYGALDGNGLILEIGTGARAAYHRYFIYSAATYPISGGWLIIPIDPTIAAYRDATVGSPNLAAVNFYGIRADFSQNSRTQNVAMDAIDFIPVGTGLTLVGGDGADADGTFQSFTTFDEGTSGNRYGIVSTKEGALYVTGVLTIGTATATVFTDSLQTVIFPSGRFGTGFCGIDINLSSATTVVTLNAITMIGRGTSGANDTRPDFGVTNTSGDAVIDACAFVNFRSITFTSGVTASDSTFNTCGTLTQSSSTIDNCTFEDSPVATNVAFLTSNNPELISNSSFISGGTGHAIEITATGTYDFSGNTFTGYSGTPGSNLVASSGSSEAAIYNNSGGAVTINITNGGDTPSIRNGASATTTVNNNIGLTITVQDEGANPIIGAQVAVFRTSDDAALISSTATNASGQVTGTAAASTGAIYIRVRQSTNTATFATTAGVNGTTEVITTDVAHSFVDGEAVVYSKNGGTAVIGLTAGTTYYVNSITSTTLSLHTSAANAIADTSRVNLTAAGAETHHLDPVRYFPTSTVGTLGTSDFSVTITMIEDTTVSG